MCDSNTSLKPGQCGKSSHFNNQCSILKNHIVTNMYSYNVLLQITRWFKYDRD